MRQLIIAFVLALICTAAVPAWAVEKLTFTENTNANIKIPNKGLIFYVPSDTEVELSGILSGKGPLIKHGAGRLILSGDNTHSGDTLVEGGILELQHPNALNTARGTIAVKGDGTYGHVVLQSEVDLHLGQAGDCRVIVSNGGYFNTLPGKQLIIGSAGRKAEINVSGTGSKLSAGGDLVLGQGAETELNVGEGGVVRAAQRLVLGDNSAKMVAYVAGENSFAIGQNVYVAYAGRVELNLLAGGRLAAGDDGAVYFGWAAGSLADVRVGGKGTQVQSGGELYLGYGGQVNLMLENGAVMETNVVASPAATDSQAYGVYLAYLEGSQAVVKLSGNSILKSRGSITVGVGGKANLDVRNRGQILFGRSLCMGYQATGYGVTRLTGSGAVAESFNIPYEADADIYDEEEEAEYDEDYAYEHNYVEDTGGPDHDYEDEEDRDFLAEKCILVGRLGQGELHVNRGARVEVGEHIYAGSFAGSKGIIQVSGADAYLVAEGNLYIGNYGHGEFLVEGGSGAIGKYNAREVYLGYNAGSKGQLDVTGAGSDFRINNSLFVGYKGQGRLNVIDGGFVWVERASILLGVEAEGEALVTVRGSQSILKSGGDDPASYEGNLEVGSYGNATLNITAGGKTSCRGLLTIGMHDHGTLNVEGQGALFQAFGGVEIGPNGYGELNLLDGAKFESLARNRRESSAYFYLGHYEEGRGVINVSGGSQFISDQTFYIGRQGKGAVNAAAGGILQIRGNLNLGYEGYGQGFLSLVDAGTKLIVENNIDIGCHSQGFVSLSNGALLQTHRRLFLGGDNYGYGEMQIDAAEVICSDLTVGLYSKGVLVAENGSKITIKEDLGIGTTFGRADGVMTIKDSTVTVANNLNVGTSGTGLLNILAGAKMTVGSNIYITWHEKFRSALNVDGPGAYLEGGKHLHVGYLGDGSMVISNGGAVKILRDVHVGKLKKGSGVLTIDGKGSTLTAGAVVESANGGSAIIHLTNGGEIILLERDKEKDELQDAIDWINSLEFSM